jgi:lipopolysaccharide transport system ATP-binding protein
MEDIVRFSGVEEFLDTPVKFYSSGMGVRLGFAVAAHMDPDILVVDEVLAVGDLEFQKKCLGKMKEVSEGGRTVLFVSHNLSLINQLCSRSLWIENGQIHRDDATATVISEYLRNYDNTGMTALSRVPEDFEKIAQILELSCRNSTTEITSYYECDESITITFTIAIHDSIPGLYGYLAFYRNDGTEVLMTDSFDTVPNPLDSLAVGTHSFMVTIPSRTLGPGNYYVGLSIASPMASKWLVDRLEKAVSFSLTDMVSQRGNSRPGFFSIMPEWRESG